MSLDITAYRQIKPATDVSPEAAEESWGFWMPGPSMEWSEAHWPGRGEGVEANTIYSFEDSFGFRAGSYGGYNMWRRRLAEFVGYESLEAAWASGGVGKPFFELLHFADNEGVIGAVVAKKLLKDFHDNATRAEAFFDVYEFGKYQDWAKAFEFAADDGAVDFH